MGSKDNIDQRLMLILTKITNIKERAVVNTNSTICYYDCKYDCSQNCFYIIIFTLHSTIHKGCRFLLI